jgi:hypothetical protein
MKNDASRYAGSETRPTTYTGMLVTIQSILDTGELGPPVKQFKMAAQFL